MVYSTRRFVVCLSMCHFVPVFFSPFSIAITSLGEERANLSAEELRFVIVALPGLFSYLFFYQNVWKGGRDVRRLHLFLVFLSKGLNETRVCCLFLICSAFS